MSKERTSSSAAFPPLSGEYRAAGGPGFHETDRQLNGVVERRQAPARGHQEQGTTEAAFAQQLAVANAGPAHFQIRPNRLTDQRTLLVSGPHFVLERIDLAPNSTWCLEAKRETWLLVLSGGARRRIVRRCRSRCRFRSVGPRRHSRRQDRHGGPRGVHGRRPGSAPAAAPRTAGLTMQAAARFRCHLPTRARAASTNSRLETTK